MTGGVAGPNGPYFNPDAAAASAAATQRAAELSAQNRNGTSPASDGPWTQYQSAPPPASSAADGPWTQYGSGGDQTAAPHGGTLGYAYAPPETKPPAAAPKSYDTGNPMGDQGGTGGGDLPPGTPLTPLTPPISYGGAPVDWAGLGLTSKPPTQPTPATGTPDKNDPTQYNLGIDSLFPGADSFNNIVHAAYEGGANAPDASDWAPGKTPLGNPGWELGKYIVNPLLAAGAGAYRGLEQALYEAGSVINPAAGRDLAGLLEAFPGGFHDFGLPPADPAYTAARRSVSEVKAAADAVPRNQFMYSDPPQPPQMSPGQVRSAIPPEVTPQVETPPQQIAPPQPGAPTHMYQGPDAVYPVTPTGPEQVFPDGRVYAEVHEPGQPPTWVPKDRVLPQQTNGVPVRQEPPPVPQPEPDVPQPPLPTIPPAPRNALAPDFVGPEAPQPVNALAPQAPQPPAPTQPVAPAATPRTAAEAKQVASQYYTAADKAGGTLTPQFTNRFIDSVAGTAPQTEAGAAVAGVNPITALVDRLQTLRDKPMTLAAAQEVDEGLGNLIDGEYGIKGLSKDGYKLQDIQHSLRDQIANAGEGDTTGGTAGFAALGPARKAWSQAMKMGDLERIQVRAALTDNEATSVKTQVRNIISNPVKARGYTPAELSALKTAANRGAVGSVMHVFGSRLVPLAVGAAGLEHGFMGAVLGGGLSHVGTGFARDLAGHIQQSRLNRAIGVVGRGVPPPP